MSFCSETLQCVWRRLVQAIKRLLSPHTPEMIVVVVWALLFRTILFNTQQLQLTLILQKTLEDMTIDYV